jgi:hypothetical protein
MASTHTFICPSLKLFKKLTMKVEKCNPLKVVDSAEATPGILLPFQVKKVSHIAPQKLKLLQKTLVRKTQTSTVAMIQRKLTRDNSK